MYRLGLFALGTILVALSPNIGGRIAEERLLEANVDSAEIPVRNEASIIDEVVWVVGDEPILKSDIEALRLQAAAEGVTWDGNPDCVIPEQIAVQKLFLHQAAIDSIEVTESEITQSIDDQIDYWIQLADGSREIS